MGTKNNPGAFDCYANAHPDEPMFVLLGRDKHAPTLVWLWATMREFDKEDPEKVKEARQCALSMMSWAKSIDKPCVGFGQATLAGLFEMIRTINAQNKLLNEKGPDNVSTDDDIVRMYLAQVTFEQSKDDKSGPMHTTQHGPDDRDDRVKP